jgi:ribonucleotide reductase alpha subunit
MNVIKRNGRQEQVQKYKIVDRIRNLCGNLNNDFINVVDVANKVYDGLCDKITTTEIDNLAAETAMYMSKIHPDYAKLAARIAITNHHKNTRDSFYETMRLIYKNGSITDKFFAIVDKNRELFDKAIDYKRDFQYDFFGFKTLMRSYLFKVNDVPVERPQDLLMRVSIAIHQNDVDSALETYQLMSNLNFIHASPTLYNAGTMRSQNSSCFLLSMQDDSIIGIYDTLGKCAQISKYAGGIGLSIHNVRAKGSYIRGTNGNSTGIVPMLKVFNDTACYVNQGGRRPGAFAIYLEPWHGDVMEYLDMKKNNGNEEERARDLFYAMWIPDLFMQRVESDGVWSLMCPNKSANLQYVYGEEFETLYTRYEAEGRFIKQLPARKVWDKIIESQIETGTPYMLYKDSANMKSNQKNLGTILSSNLCVVGDTKILTDEGYQEIQELVDENINIWNGEKFSKTVVRKTGENQKIIKVVLSNGSVVECTEYHKFYIQNKSDIVKYEAKDLENGMKLIKHDLPHIKTEDSKLTWFRDHCKKNGVVDDGNLYVEFVDYANAFSTLLMLQTVGIQSNVVDNKLVLSCTSLDKLGCDVLSCDEYVSVVDVIDEGKYADTYCFTENERNMGMFNGVLLGNCAEIVQYTSPKEIAVCNLASIGLPKLVENGVFDFEKLGYITSILTKNLNKIIDINFYPVEEAEYSNMKHRPIGIGVQGLADVFMMMKMPFGSEDAKELNKMIFETMYYYSLKTSMEISKEDGYYETFIGSPASKGILQFDMWNVEPSDRYNWKELKDDIMRYGIRNSLLIALMPTAGTSQILGNSECIEPYLSNVFTRRTMAGEFIIVNKFLVGDLIKMGLWSSEMRDRIIYHNGSIQNIPEIPDELKEIYKTAFEVKQKDLIDMSADRGAYVCQSQSLNLFVDNPEYRRLTTMHFYGWKRGLKTGQYYLRSNPAANATKFGIDTGVIKGEKKVECNDEVCVACSA